MRQENQFVFLKEWLPLIVVFVAFIYKDQLYQLLNLLTLNQIEPDLMSQKETSFDIIIAIFIYYLVYLILGLLIKLFKRPLTQKEQIEKQNQDIEAVKAQIAIEKEFENIQPLTLDFKLLLKAKNSLINLVVILGLFSLLLVIMKNTQDDSIMLISLVTFITLFPILITWCLVKIFREIVNP